MQPVVTARSAARQAATRARAAWHRRRLPRPPVVLTDRRGARFELVSAEEVENFDRHDGHFEERELDYLAATLREGIAIDVGANIGMFTVTMARALADRGTVHACEPLPAALARLRRTVELNGLDNVVVHETALSDAPGEAQLLTYGGGLEGWASLTRDRIELPDGDLTPTAEVTIPTITLDAFCEAQRIDRVAVLKIDVEGAEGRVLAGARGLLSEQRVDLVLMELSDITLASDGVRSADLLTQVAELGYSVCILDQHARPVPYTAPEHVEFENVLLRPVTRTA